MAQTSQYSAAGAGHPRNAGGWHSRSHSSSQSRPHSPSEAGRKTRHSAFVTQRVTATFNLGAGFARNPNQTLPIALHPTPQAVDSVATEFTSVVFRILHYRNFQYFRVVQNPENHRNESGGGSIDGLQVRRSQNAHNRHLAA